jgi:carboxyl-terminal processing protease
MRRLRGFQILKLVGLPLILLLTCGSLEATVPKPNPGNQATAILVQKLLQDHHFAGKPLTEEKAREWIRAYMEALDYNHAFYLESDLKAYQDNYAPQLAKFTQRGDITPAYEIFSGFNDRVRERLDWIKRRLTLPFDFSSDQTYEIDRTRVGWPADRAAAEELWERRLKFDLLREKLVNQTVSETAKAEKKKEEDPLTTVTKRYDRLLKNLEDYDNEEISQLYLTALASLYDPHSSYMSPSTLEDFSIGIKLALVGIGAVLSSEDGYCIIKELVPGGPADLDGRLKVGDKIVGVAQGEGHFEDIVDMKLRNAVKKIRGPKNTIVRLQVIPVGSSAGELREIQITRDEVKLSAQQASATIFDLPKSGQAAPTPVQSIQPETPVPANANLWDQLKSRIQGKADAKADVAPVEIPAKKSAAWRIGVIDLPSFYGEVGGADSAASGNGATPRSTSEDVELLIKQLNQASVDGVILDLRKNGGGLLDEAVALTGLFIDQGPVVQVRDGKGTVIQRTDENPGILYRGPLLVLVGRRSASASEIVAGALQNYDRAIIVGEKSTHGKGTVQAVVELGKFLQRPDQSQPKAGAMKLTIQKFYLPNGHSTQNRGVIPDITIPSPLDYMKIGESDLPNPLPWDEIQPARFEPLPLDPSLNAVLKDKSKERLSSDPDVTFLQQDIEKVRSRLEAGTISLNETRRLEEKKVDDQRNEQRKKIEERIQQVLSPTVHLVIDAKKDAAVATEKNPKKKKPTLEESADGESEGVTDAVDLAETLELREGLRIMTDWLALSTPSQAGTIAKDKEPAKTTSVK